jgi:hypothetical protein
VKKYSKFVTAPSQYCVRVIRNLADGVNPVDDIDGTLSEELQKSMDIGAKEVLRRFREHPVGMTPDRILQHEGESLDQFLATVPKHRRSDSSTDKSSSAMQNSNACPIPVGTAGILRWHGRCMTEKGQYNVSVLLKNEPLLVACMISEAPTGRCTNLTGLRRQGHSSVASVAIRRATLRFASCCTTKFAIVAISRIFARSASNPGAGVINARWTKAQHKHTTFHFRSWTLRRCGQQARLAWRRMSYGKGWSSLFK